MVDLSAHDLRQNLESVLDRLIEPASIQRAVRSDDGVIVDFEIEYANVRFTALLARPRELLIGRRVFELLPQLREAERFDACVQVVDQGTPFFATGIVYGASDEDDDVGRVGDVLLTKFGDGLLAAWRDTTERDRAVRELERSRSDLAEIHRLAQLGTFEFDLRTGALWLSDELYEMCAIDRRATSITTVADCTAIMDPADAARMPAVLEAAMTAVEPVHEELRFVRPDGQERVASVTIHARNNRNGEVSCLRGTALDITRRRRFETELLAHRHALEEAQRLTRIGSWYCGLDNDAVLWSPQMFRLFGLDPSAGPPPHGQWNDFVHPDDRDKPREARHKALVEHNSFKYEARFRRSDGREWIGVVIGEPVMNDAGVAITGVRGTVQDITELRRAEDQLAASRAALADERAVVHLLQPSALPTKLPELPQVEMCAHYSSADTGMNVGGDWYDAFERTDNALVLMVGDVVGHGLGAAAAMAQLRNATRAYAFEGLEPTVVFERLDALMRTLYPDEMATAVLAYYDLIRHRLRWARAGHPYPLAARSDGEVAVLTAAAGVPLGAGGSERTPFTQADLPLDPSDSVLLYTDGMVERRGASIDDGIAALGEVLARQSASPLSDIRRGLLEACCDERSDDQCLLLVRRRPSPTL